MQRRTLLKGAVALGASLAVSRKAAFAAAADSRIEVLLDEPLGTISPAVYGHFTEMLGAVVYDGIWVGENSKIPNTGGLRKSVIDKLRQIKAPMVRWPGGCFADSYDWMDGIGAPAKRPERGAFWRGEPNTFGTPEFMRFCRLTGSEPYFAANVRSLSPLAFDHWVEYCNAPAEKSSLARMRADDGSREPYNVKYWGIGNESWGCGGNLTPGEYSEEFRKYTTWTPTYGAPLNSSRSAPAAKISTGPSSSAGPPSAKSVASAPRVSMDGRFTITPGTCPAEKRRTGTPAKATPFNSTSRTGMRSSAKAAGWNRSCCPTGKSSASTIPTTISSWLSTIRHLVQAWQRGDSSHAWVSKSPCATPCLLRRLWTFSIATPRRWGSALVLSSSTA